MALPVAVRSRSRNSEDRHLRHMVRYDQVGLGRLPDGRDGDAGANSFRSRPSAVGSMTAISVTIRLTGRAAVSGREQCWTIFGLPLTVWVIATMTRLAPDTRSMAPPIPGTIRPGTIQLASRPC